MTDICSARVTIDFDSVSCRLAADHRGFHECEGDGPAIKWIEKHVGSTGYSSPRDTWPDDSEVDQSIADAESFSEALWEIAEKYGVSLTNNSVRWQEGVFVRHVGDFIGDIQNARKRFFPGATVSDPQRKVGA